MTASNLEKFNILIKESESLLQDASSVRTIGNRPHFPMMIMFNNTVEQSNWEIVKKKLIRLWTQTAHHLVVGSYAITNSEIQFEQLYKEFLAEDVAVEDALAKSINDTLRNAGVFVDVSKWLLFNVIDTESMRDAKDFEECYNALPQLANALGNPFSSMLIVILRDEKAVGNDLAQDIRRLIAERVYGTGDALYNSVFIISDRTRKNNIVDTEELYSVLSDVLIMSNNDAVTESDDEDFTQRMHIMFGGKVLGIAYIKKEKPNKRITLQIYDELVKRMKSAEEKQAGGNGNKDKIKNAILNLNNSDVSTNIVERYLPKNLREIIESLPVRQLIIEGRIVDLSYDVYSRDFEVDSSIMSSVADEIVSSYGGGSDKEAVEALIRRGLNDILIPVWSTIEDADINYLLDSCEAREVSKYLSVADYYREMLINEIEKKYVEPDKKKTIKKIVEEAKQRKKEIDSMLESYQMVKPPDGYGELGELYSEAARKYLDSEAGEKALSRIWSLSHQDKSVYELMEETFDEIVKSNPNGVFTLTFIDEWSKRLKKSGEMIYRQISDELRGEIRDRIMLFGNYTVNEILKVYMMHTTDADDQNPTELFSHLKATFKDDSKSQYINTGYDDSLEAITLIELSKLDIELA